MTPTDEYLAAVRTEVNLALLAMTDEQMKEMVQSYMWSFYTPEMIRQMAQEALDNPDDEEKQWFSLTRRKP